MIPVWIALGAIVVMLVVAAAHRLPIWNPTYFFGVVFALQIGAGFFFARRLGMDVPLGFSLPLLGAYLLTVGLFLGFSIRDREIVTGNTDLREQFGLIELTPRAVRALGLVLLAVALHNTVVNLILIVRWETLPAIAFKTYRRSFAASAPGVTLPQDVASPFSVPFFTTVAGQLINPAVVIYLALLYLPKTPTGSTRTVGIRSVPWWAHTLLGVILLNGMIVHRRAPLLFGIATAVLLLYLLGKFPWKAMVTGAVVLLVGTVALGQLRRGTEQFRPARELDLPAVAGNTMVYEPLVYVGTGVPNFLRYWSEDHPPTGGELHLSSLFPQPVDRALGLDMNRTRMLRKMFQDGFVIPGQTLRTPWFEVFFDFGWPGVYVLALVFPAGVHWLYRRTLVGPERDTPSLAFFAMAKVIYIFPLISQLFALPFWATAAAAMVIDWQLGRSARPRGAEPRLREARP